MSSCPNQECRWTFYGYLNFYGVFSRQSPAIEALKNAIADVSRLGLNSVSSSVATYDISRTDTKALKLVQSETYHLAKDSIHPVGELEQSLPDFAITDPSGKFLLVPDPGADFVRIYLLNEDGRLRFTDLAPLIIPGGPRYADFLVTLDGTVYLYVTTANTNMIKGYKVLYTSSTTVEFTNIQESKISANAHDVGGDIHISVIERPDIAFSVNVLTTVSISPIVCFYSSHPEAKEASQYQVPRQLQIFCRIP